MNELIEKMSAEMQKNGHVSTLDSRKLGNYVLDYLAENQCKKFDDCRDLLDSLARCNFKQLVDFILPKYFGTRGFALLFCYNEALAHKAEQRRRSENCDVDPAMLDASFYTAVNAFKMFAHSRRMNGSVSDEHTAAAKCLITMFSETVTAQKAYDEPWEEKFMEIDEQFDLDMFMDFFFKEVVSDDDQSFEAELARLAQSTDEKRESIQSIFMTYEYCRGVWRYQMQATDPNDKGRRSGFLLPMLRLLDNMWLVETVSYYIVELAKSWVANDVVQFGRAADDEQLIARIQNLFLGVQVICRYCEIHNAHSRVYSYGQWRMRELLRRQVFMPTDVPIAEFIDSLDWFDSQGCTKLSYTQGEVDDAMQFVVKGWQFALQTDYVPVAKRAGSGALRAALLISQRDSYNDMLEEIVKDEKRYTTLDECVGTAACLPLFAFAYLRQRPRRKQRHQKTRRRLHRCKKRDR